MTVLEQAYQPNIQPLLKTYCHECHSGDEAEAEMEVDLVVDEGSTKKEAHEMVASRSSTVAFNVGVVPEAEEAPVATVVEVA